MKKYMLLAALAGLVSVFYVGCSGDDDSGDYGGRCIGTTPCGQYDNNNCPSSCCALCGDVGSEKCSKIDSVVCTVQTGDTVDLCASSTSETDCTANNAISCYWCSTDNTCSSKVGACASS